MRRIFVFVIPLIVSLIILYFFYTYNRALYYNNNSIYEQKIEINYNVDENITLGDIIISNKEIVLIISPYNRKKINISHFESFLLYDYANYILDLYKCNEKNKSDSGVAGFNILTINNLYPSGSIYRDNFKGDFKINLFVFIALTIIYSRKLIPLLLATYLLFIIIGYVIGKKNNLKSDFKNKSENFKYILYTVNSVLFYIGLDYIFSKEKIYYSLTQQICFYPHLSNKINIVIGIILLITESLIIFAVFRKLALCIYNVISGSILMFIHKLVFRGDSLYAGIPSKLRNVIGFYETFPIYPKIIYFTVFFIIGFIIYYLCALVINKKKYENYYMAVVFSFNSSLLICMNSYLVPYLLKFI